MSKRPKHQPSTSDSLQDEVEDRFGVLPNFFRLAPEAPGITENLWGFAKFGYLDNPLPTLFKERLFVYLSRFCEVRYCIARHVGFLAGLGRPAGDRQCPPETVEQIVKLLRRPLPRGDELEPQLVLLEAFSSPPPTTTESGTPTEEAVFACAAHVFLQTPQASRCLEGLRHVFDEVMFQHLLVFLAFVRMAHFWTKLHPELQLENDLTDLLAVHEALAECVNNDPEAAACDTTQSLLSELAMLRRERALRQDIDRTNMQLREREGELRDAQRVAHLGSWRWDAKLDRTTGSDELFRIFGLDRTSETFPNFKDQDGTLYPHEEWERINQAAHETLRSGIGDVMDVRAFRDGNPIWISARSEVVKNDAGDVVGLRGTVQDITDRKRTEQKLRTSEVRMRLMWEAAAVLLTTDAPETMLRQLFAKIGPHLKLDTYFNFMVNDGGNGLKLASCTGIPDEAARGIENLAFGQAICGTVALHRQPITATFIQRSDDPKAQLVKSFGIRAYACNPLMSGDELLGTLSFASRSRDEFDYDELEFLRTICRYVAAAYERLRLIGRLREADRRKDEFLATLAHELRNPLAPIRNGLQIMRLAQGEPEATEQAHAMMERQLEQMVHLVDDLLDLSRISRGKIALRKERIELAKIIRQAVETSRPAIDQAGHELLIDVPTSPIYVDADLTRLAQVFSNLLNNAAKYTERGGRVRLTMQRHENEAVVAVKDSGVGIPVHMLPNVFDMFTQVDRNLERSQGGLGIGLSIVKRLVEMHDGCVEAKSDGHGMGSEFIVRLPRVSSIVTPQQDRREATRPSSRCRVLVVDDNQDAAVSLAMMLKLMGDEAQTAHDGIEALKVAAEFRPDLILLDIGMPRLNGYDTAKEIRKETWSKDVVLVALTGWGQEDDRRRSDEAGFDSHMIKPIDPASLEKLLADVRANTA